MTAPDSLPANADALRALLLAERARHGEERERWMAIIAMLQRHRFGRRSERLDPEQLALALEDVEQMLAAADAAAEKDDTPPVKLPQRASGRSIAARCRCICRAKRLSSMWRTRPARAAAASSTASARTSRSGSM